VWNHLERAAELQTEAYKLMGGSTKYTVSDLLEAGGEMYLRSLVDDVGELPETNETRKAFVKRLAELNQKLLAEDLLGKSSTH
jgi:tRNA A37 N6-isopentenylltransferase MiaA